MQEYYRSGRHENSGVEPPTGANHLYIMFASVLNLVLSRSVQIETSGR